MVAAFGCRATLLAFADVEELLQIKIAWRNLML